MLSNFFTLVYALGAVQSVLVFALLWHRKNNHPANRYLSFFVLSLGVACAYTVYLRSEAFRQDPRWLFLIDPLDFVFCPLIFLYTRSLLSGGKGIRRAGLHFVPAGLFLFFDAHRMFSPGSTKLAILLHPLPGEARLFWIWDRVMDAQGLIYLGLSLYALRVYRASLDDNYSDTSRLTLTWLRTLLGGLLALWCGSIFSTLACPALAPWVHLCLVALFYAIGFLSLGQPQIFARPLGEGPPPRPKTAPAGQQAALAERLRELLEKEKVYLDPELTIATLAERLGAPAYLVSQLINGHFGETFYNLINSRRVEEFQRRLRDPGCSEDKILSVGLECGFNSKSTLNATFKKFAGVTPSQFRAKALADPARPR